MTDERGRLAEARAQAAPWRKWGPYLSERQWGTVREDYGPTGDAWNYLSHDLARSLAYRWGEDGLAGISDDRQLLCFAVALWNGRDPILKERLFGLTNSEGNHGEDVKEYYFYLDSTPTHSYMRYLYKYPQARLPLRRSAGDQPQRSRTDLEYELLDTGVFDEDRYFDVFVEYAKAGPEDFLMELSVFNRGPEAATLHLLPTLWFRNTWRRGAADRGPDAGAGRQAAARSWPPTPERGNYVLRCPSRRRAAVRRQREQPARWRRVEAPTGTTASTPVLQGRHQRLPDRRREAGGQPAAARHQGRGALRRSTSPRSGAPSCACASPASPIRRDRDPPTTTPRSAARSRRCWRRAGARPTSTTRPSSPPHSARIAATSCGRRWPGCSGASSSTTTTSTPGSTEHGAGRAAASMVAAAATSDWSHMVSDDIISMPDKWEYPWYAAWDLAFHTIPLGLVDPDFAKQPALLLLRERYLHPNGQMPGLRVELRRREPARARLGRLLPLRPGQAPHRQGRL